MEGPARMPGKPGACPFMPASGLGAVARRRAEPEDSGQTVPCHGKRSWAIIRFEKPKSSASR